MGGVGTGVAWKIVEHIGSGVIASVAVILKELKISL